MVNRERANERYIMARAGIYRKCAILYVCVCMCVCAVFIERWRNIYKCNKYREGEKSARDVD